ncbi:MAG: hypothetical protein IJT36_00610 [Alphaproteobacteria bacterium]|nr:hypothetical protein [Alphaproteobacteria bacterium]
MKLTKYRRQNAFSHGFVPNNFPQASVKTSNGVGCLYKLTFRLFLIFQNCSFPESIISEGNGGFFWGIEQSQINKFSF